MRSFVFRPASMSWERRAATIAAFGALVAIAHDLPPATLVFIVLSALAIHSSHLFLQLFARAYAMGLLLFSLLFVIEGGYWSLEPATLVVTLIALLAPGAGPLRSDDAMKQFHPLAARRLFLVGCFAALVFTGERLFSTPVTWRWALPGVVSAIGVLGVLRMRSWGVFVLMALPTYSCRDIVGGIRLLGSSPANALDMMLPAFGPTLVLAAVFVARKAVRSRRSDGVLRPG